MESVRIMWKTIHDICDPIGNIASVAGLLVSVIGFWVTIKSAVTAKSAARGAESAAKDAKDSILKTGAVAKFSIAVALMEEIKSLQRRKEWGTLLDRYAQARRVLTELKGEAIGLTEEHLGVLGSVMVQIDDLEKKVDKTHCAGKPPPDVVKMNEIVSTQIGKVLELSTKFRVK